MKTNSVRWICAIVLCFLVSTLFITAVNVENNFDIKNNFGFKLDYFKTVNLDNSNPDYKNIYTINAEIDTYWNIKPIEDEYTKLMYHFDDNLGTEAEDTSTNENNGTVVGAEWATGIFDAALDFELSDGDDYVGTLHDPALSLANEFTVEAWVKPESIGNKMCILGKGLSGDPTCHYIFVLNQTGYFYLTYEYDAGTSSSMVFSTTQAVVDTWYHVAVSFNSTSLNMYINGTLEASNFDSNLPVANTNSFFVGEMHAWSSGIYDFDGIIDEVRISNCSRTFTTFIGVDTDNDGLSDEDELIYGTNPNDPDTDDDQLTDGSEVHSHLTNPLLNDTDIDDLLDGEEVLGIYFPSSINANSTGYIFPDPLDNDTDDDTYIDGFEIESNTDPTDPTKAPNDLDHDGIVDSLEPGIGTDPNNNDSDFDGLLDGAEYYGFIVPGFAYHNGSGYIVTDPTDNDTDDDELLDFDEVYLSETNPVDADTEDDGMTDGYEYYYGLNPFIDDSNGDPDQDGLINQDEFVHKTDPFNSDTDGDGASDALEVNKGTDPLDPNDTPFMWDLWMTVVSVVFPVVTAIIGGGYTLLRSRRKKLEEANLSHESSPDPKNEPETKSENP